MADLDNQKRKGINYYDPILYETDPSKIADTTTLGGALKGIAGMATGGIGNMVNKAATGIANTMTDHRTPDQKQSDAVDAANYYIDGGIGQSHDSFVKTPVVSLNVAPTVQSSKAIPVTTAAPVSPSTTQNTGIIPLDSQGKPQFSPEQWATISKGMEIAKNRTAPAAEPQRTPLVVPPLMAATGPEYDAAKAKFIADTGSTEPIVGIGSYINDNGKIINASGPATGGFGISEENRLKNVANVAGREDAYNKQQTEQANAAKQKAVQDRISSLNETIRANMGNQYDGQEKIAAAQAELKSITGQQEIGIHQSNVDAINRGHDIAQEGHKLALQGEIYKSNNQANWELNKQLAANQGKIEAAKEISGRTHGNATESQRKAAGTIIKSFETRYGGRTDSNKAKADPDYATYQAAKQTLAKATGIDITGNGTAQTENPSGYTPAGYAPDGSQLFTGPDGKLHKMKG